MLVRRADLVGRRPVVFGWLQFEYVCLQRPPVGEGTADWDLRRPDPSNDWARSSRQPDKANGERASATGF